MKLLEELLEELPEELERQVFTHASWSERSSDSYTRLAFLGDSVLALAVTTHLYPRLEAERFGAGRLTKIRAQAVSGPSCRVVAERLEVPRSAARGGARGRRGQHDRGARGNGASTGIGDRGGDRGVLPGRGLRTHSGGGGARRSNRRSSRRWITRWTSSRRCKSYWRVAGAEVSYEVIGEEGPPHDRTFVVVAKVDGGLLGSGQRPQQEARRAGGRARGRRRSAGAGMT